MTEEQEKSSKINKSENQIADENNFKINKNVVDNAKYIIKYFNDNDCEITFQKLNRLLYLYEAIYMVVTSKDKLFDDNFYANSFEIDNAAYIEEYKNYGILPIVLKSDSELQIPNTNKIFIDALYNLFKDWSLAELISLTTSDNSPWGKINDKSNNDIPRDIKIDKAETRIWFSGIVNIDEKDR